MDLEISERVLDDYAVVELRGELDISSAEELRDRLLGILGVRVPSLVLDLSELAFIDSTGLSVLVAAARRAGEAGGTLSLAGPQKIVARVLRVTSLDKRFPVFATVADAVAALRGSSGDAAPGGTTIGDAAFGGTTIGDAGSSVPAG